MKISRRPAAVSFVRMGRVPAPISELREPFRSIREPCLFEGFPTLGFLHAEARSATTKAMEIECPDDHARLFHRPREKANLRVSQVHRLDLLTGPSQFIIILKEKEG